MSERFQPEELRSLAINVDMLLANREQYNCMARFKELILRTLDEAKGLRQRIEEELQNLEPPKPQDSENSWTACLSHVMGILSSWTGVVREELGFLETCIEKSPEPPRLLYAMAPPPEALPMFYPVIWPNILEPYDGEIYVDLV